jgi:chorismate mutase
MLGPGLVRAAAGAFVTVAAKVEPGGTMNSMDEKVQDLRSEIDLIDLDFLRLLNARGELVLEILSRKRQLGLEAHDPDREREILERLQRMNEGPLPGTAVEDIFRMILDHSLASLARIVDSTATGLTAS